MPRLTDNLGRATLSWFLLATLLGHGALAQIPAPPPPPPPPSAPIRIPASIPGAITQKMQPEELGSISGTVLRSTGEPVAKAQVSPVRIISGQILAGPRSAPIGTAVTDAEGRFTVDNVPPDLYRMHVTRNGYVAEDFRSTAGNPQLVRVQPKQKVTGVEVVIQPQAAIEGRITNAFGEPVQGANVLALMPDYSSGMIVGPRPNDATDDRGVYRISGLAPGRYQLLVDTPRNSTPTESADEIDVATYYPNVLRRGEAISLRLGAGQELQGMDIEIRREPVSSVSGTVVDEAGQPVAGATVFQLIDDSVAGRRPTGRQATTDEHGRFQLTNLAQGSLTLSGVAGNAIRLTSGRTTSVVGGLTPTSLRRESSGRISLTLSGDDVNDVVIPIGPGGTLTGRFEIEDEDIRKFMPDEPIEASVPWFSFSLQPVEGTAVNLGRLFVKTDGTFQVDGVPPGVYYVAPSSGMLTTLQGYYIKQILLDGQDITHMPANLATGNGTLRIVLAQGSGTVRGSVANRDGNPMAGRWVTLFPQTLDLGQQDRGVRTTVTDQTGNFEFVSLSPGDYYAVAWDRLPEPGLQNDPEFVAQFVSTASKIKLAPSGDQSVQIDMIPAGRAASVFATLP